MAGARPATTMLRWRESDSFIVVAGLAPAMGAGGVPTMDVASNLATALLPKALLFPSSTFAFHGSQRWIRSLLRFRLLSPIVSIPGSEITAFIHPRKNASHERAYYHPQYTKVLARCI